jgi:hypothetical protein
MCCMHMAAASRTSIGRPSTPTCWRRAALTAGRGRGTCAIRAAQSRATARGTRRRRRSR